jgi:hypothetical protein
MFVIYRDETYTANMTHGLLMNLKKVSPDLKIKITESNQSTYKKEFEVRVAELTDYSVYRNELALR